MDNDLWRKITLDKRFIHMQDHIQDHLKYDHGEVCLSLEDIEWTELLIDMLVDIRNITYVIEHGDEEDAPNASH